MRLKSHLAISESQVIEFYQYEKALRVFVMNPDTFYHWPITLENRLDLAVDSVKGFQRYTSSDSINLYSVRKYLFEKLLKVHLDSNYQNLIIVPDGILNGIAFETLVNVDGEALVNNYNISYSFGMNAVTTWSQEKFDIKKASFVSFTNQETLGKKGKREYLELAGAQKEVEKCAKLFPKKSTRIYSGPKCTNKNIGRTLRSDIAHIATHAVSDPESSIGNYMITRSGEKTLKSYGYEYNNQKTNCKLAVLSACETGIGKFEVGEGVFSLSRNLQQAGVPSVVKTLWKVDDESSYFLMEYFYKYLSSGATLTSALASAKKDYIIYHNADPYFWSGYVLEGNPLSSFSF